MNNTAADAFKAMGHPVRLRIIDILATGEKCVCEIFQVIGVSQPNASQHLNVMRASGVVSSRRRGANVYYRLTSPDLADLVKACRSIVGEPEPEPYVPAVDPCEVPDSQPEATGFDLSRRYGPGAGTEAKGGRHRC